MNWLAVIVATVMNWPDVTGWPLAKSVPPEGRALPMRMAASPCPSTSLAITKSAGLKM